MLHKNNFQDKIKKCKNTILRTYHLKINLYVAVDDPKNLYVRKIIYCYVLDIKNGYTVCSILKKNQRLYVYY